MKKQQNQKPLLDNLPAHQLSINTKHKQTQGGIWGRPDTDEGGDQFGGDRTGGLAVLGESSPLAFIVEEAGGMAVDGHGKRVLDIYPEALRQKTGLFVGGKDDMEELERALEGKSGGGGEEGGEAAAAAA